MDGYLTGTWVRPKNNASGKGKAGTSPSSGARRFILGVIVTFLADTGDLCAAIYNPLSQFIFLLLLWGVALLVRRVCRDAFAILIVLSLTVSCRYIWWRAMPRRWWDDGQSGVRADSAVWKPTLDCAGAAGCFGGVAVKSSFGAVPKEMRSGRRWIFCTDL